MVAGGAGFVGSALVRELLDHGTKVVCYDNYFHGDPRHLDCVSGPLKVVQGDVLDLARLVSVLKEESVEYIVDCVGDTFVPTAYNTPQRFLDINVQGTFNVLMAAMTCGINRTLYVSSAEVYGDSQETLLSENAQLNPVNTYAVSKLAADRLCFTLHVEHGIPVVIARIFNCYGPRETHPYIIPEIISQLCKNRLLYLGNLQARRDLTYVDDTARALVAILEADIRNGEAINVGSGTLYSVEWLAYELAEIMGVGSPEIQQVPRRLRRLDIDHFQCDNRKLLQYTRWEPRISIREGLNRTVAWFRSNGCHWIWEGCSRDTRFVQPRSEWSPQPWPEQGIASHTMRHADIASEFLLSRRCTDPALGGREVRQALKSPE